MKHEPHNNKCKLYTERTSFEKGLMLFFTVPIIAFSLLTMVVIKGLDKIMQTIRFCKKIILFTIILALLSLTIVAAAAQVIPGI